MQEKEEQHLRYRTTLDDELASLKVRLSVKSNPPLTCYKTDLLEAQEKARAAQTAMTQSASELQYLLSSYKTMQEQMDKQKEKTLQANTVRGQSVLVHLVLVHLTLRIQKIKELSLRMEFLGNKQVVDVEPPEGLVTYVGFDIEVRVGIVILSQNATQGAHTLWRKNSTEIAAMLPQYLNAVRLTSRQYKGSRSGRTYLRTTGFEMMNSSSSFVYARPLYCAF